MPDELVHSTFQYFLKQVLKTGDSKNGYVLNAANSVLIDKYMKLAPEYKSDIEDLYQVCTNFSYVITITIETSTD